MQRQCPRMQLECAEVSKLAMNTKQSGQGTAAPHFLPVPVTPPVHKSATQRATQTVGLDIPFDSD